MIALYATNGYESIAALGDGVGDEIF